MTSQLSAPVVPAGLTAHLASWLGHWPPRTRREVVGSRQRVQPGWDGRIHPFLAVADPARGTVLSVPPPAAPPVRARLARHEESDEAWDSLLSDLPALIGAPQRSGYRAVFRWTTEPAPLPEVGRWVPADTAGLPGWLRPFGGDSARGR